MNKKISILLVLSLFFVSCSDISLKKSSKPKNVILLIGDGMGPGQVSLLYYFLKHTQNESMKSIDYAFEKMNKNMIGISSTQPYGNIVVDSACSATQLASGESSRSEMIGLDINGDPIETILEKAQKRGLSTGLVTDTRMTHATPAAFATHVANRWSEDDIAVGYLDSMPDVLLSGGANRFVPKGHKELLSNHFTVKSRRSDKRNLLREAKEKNYQIIHSKKELKNIQSNKKLLGLFTDHSMPDALWFHNQKNNPKRQIPTLLEMSQVAIEKLSKNDKGFFLMIEAGQIDWAGHRNDAGTMLHEMLSMNETLNWVANWVKDHPDTLLVVTADHETGAFGLGYNIHDLPTSQKLSGEKFKTQDFRPNFNYGKYETLDKLFLQKKSFNSTWKEFKSLNKNKKNANELRKLVLRDTGFNMSLEKTKAVLASEPNKFQAKWHRNLKVDTLPKVHDFREYYYDTPNIRTSLIGRAIAAQQNVIWGTGGHTASPVHVYSLGDKEQSKLFSGQMTHPKLGKRLQQVLGLN